MWSEPFCGEGANGWEDMLKDREDKKAMLTCNFYDEENESSEYILGICDALMQPQNKHVGEY